MPGENAPDEAIRDPLQSFRVQIFRPVIDQITTSINERFSVNAELIKNTASFDPQRFDELLENGIQLESIEKIANIIDVPWSSLRSELLSFISVFKSLGRTLQQDIEAIGDGLNDVSDEDSEIDEENELNEKSPQDGKCKGECKKCMKCCYKMLHMYSLHSSAFSNLFLAYEYLLTLSFTQVSCERVFSKLKIVKSHLRSSLANERLETFLLMGCERDILESMSCDGIIQYLCNRSSSFKRLLEI